MNIDEHIQKVIGACYQVYNTLGPGFLESVYENSLIIELQDLGIKVSSQVAVPVFYKKQNVGDFKADLLVEDQLLIELKAVANLNTAHEVQLVNYLTATGINDGLLINFGSGRVKVKRKFREYKHD